MEILGWAGAAAVIAAYGLNSYQKIKSDSIIFQLLNLFGGVSLIIYTLYLDAYASTFINIVWVIIAVSALIKIFTRTKAA